MQCNASLRQQIWPAEVISKRYLYDPDFLRPLKTSFRETGYVKLSNFLTRNVFNSISLEVIRLYSARVRKNFIMPDFNTDRKMSTLSGKEVVRQSYIIAGLYACHELRNWIANMVGTDIHAVMHDDEFLVINFLDRKRDTHGWHLDDPRYALIIVVESPAEHVGGCIEYVPDWKRIAREAGFDSYHNVEHGVEFSRREGLLRSDVLKAGDCYLLDAAEVLHRVSPMLAEGRRMALNFAFDDRRYRVFGETATKLYA